MNSNVYYLDQNGYDDISNEKKELREREKEVLVKLNDARANGDLSENQDYKAAREEQAKIKKRLVEVERILKNAQIIEAIDDGVVGFCKDVDVLYVNENETYTFRILGSIQADPKAKIISNESPLGQAIMGKKIGDIVQFTSPKGKEFNVKILDIRI